MNADDMLRLTDPIRLEISPEGPNVYIHTTGAMWLNLFCTRCDARLRGVDPPTRGPATRSRSCRACATRWLLLVTPLDRTTPAGAERRYRVEWAPL